MTLGDTTRAVNHAAAAYRAAWADGEPYVRRHDLTRATALLNQLNVETPNLPPTTRRATRSTFGKGKSPRRWQSGSTNPYLGLGWFRPPVGPHSPLCVYSSSCRRVWALLRVRVNAEQGPDGQAKPLRFLPFEDYLLWRNVGLRGPSSPTYSACTSTPRSAG
jgi:hypothetical protein